MRPATRTRAIVFALGTVPALALAARFLTDGLGAEPIGEVTHVTGESTLRFLIATLAVTPLRRWLGWRWLAPARRSLGLLAFAYGTLHLLTWAVLDQGLAWTYLIEDVLERPYITVGLGAWLLMLPLAVTSTRGWMRRLGARWRPLHRLAYVAAIGGVLHYLWLVKADLVPPLLHGAAVLALLGLRLWPRRPLPAVRSAA